jgi:flagellar hook-basal body complex protein FliE
MAATAPILALTPSGGAGAVARKATAADGFADTLGKLIDGVEQKTAEANTAVSGMLTKQVDVHDAMIAMHEAEATLQLTVQIRNKLVQAYQDIMRMPI